VIGGLQPSWTSYLPKTLLGLVAQFTIGLVVKFKISYGDMPYNYLFKKLKQVVFE
jgi:hypothetical protein